MKKEKTPFKLDYECKKIFDSDSVIVSTKTKCPDFKLERHSENKV